MAAMRDNSGFSLIEVLISMVIMGVVMLSLAFTYISIKQKNLNDLLRQKADEVMVSVLEDLRSRSYSDIVAYSISSSTEINVDNLNVFCSPDNMSITIPLHTGILIFRSSSENSLGTVPYRVVFKTFNSADENLGMSDTSTVIATICWKSWGGVKYLSRRTVIISEGML